MRHTMTYQESMEYINSVNRYGSVLGLDNTRELLKRLDNPQDKLRFVHVAGTNGKGSVCAYITAILSSAGYRVGRYISPTIFSYRERIQIVEKKTGQEVSDGEGLGLEAETQYISEENMAKHLTAVRAAITEMTNEGLSHPTVFEIETAMAFLEFLEAGCQVVVLETGMGGREDATNVITTTECAVLTSISMDHMAVLGDTLEQIAKEKAGIIKKGIQVVSYEQKPEAGRVIEEQVKKEQAKLVKINFSHLSDLEYSLCGTSFCYQSERAKRLFFGKDSTGQALGQSGKIHLKTSLLGENQPKNAIVAVEAALSLKEIGYAITGENILEGIQSAGWRGRLEIVSRKPLILVDGAHNYEAALSLKRSMEIYFKGKQIYAVVGIFADKEYDKVLSVTLPLVQEVFTITPHNARAVPSWQLAECASQYCDKVTDAETVQKALKLAKQRAGREGVILCFGSLSFLHEVYQNVR